MSDQKKFASYALIAIGSAGLIAGTVTLKYCSNLSPLIAGGIIGSMLPLIGCTLIGILSLIDRNFLNKTYGNVYDQKKIDEKAKLLDSLKKCVIPATVGVVVSFGVGAGLAALGLESPLVISALTLMANAVIISLLSKVIERSSSPSTPPEGRECEDEPGTKRKCQTHTTNKNSMDEELSRILEEDMRKSLLKNFHQGHQSGREREDKSSTTGKYKGVYNIFGGGSVDGVNKRSSCPSH